ncbi:MAG: type II toxin-antitoxin system RelE/ParE family toxin [Pirellulales bacterium]
MAADDEPRKTKPLVWVGSSLRDLRRFPKAVRTVFGQALFDAQRGDKHPDAKPLRGFRGAGVLEVVESDEGNAFRAVYTVRFAELVYVLHAFQKKSKSGIKTPVEDMAKIRNRLKDAEAHYARWKEQQHEEDDRNSSGTQ